MKRWLFAGAGVALAGIMTGSWYLAKGATDSAAPVIVECDTGIYCDQYGLIIHPGDRTAPDGGDTAQREGWYWIGVWLTNHTPGLKPWRPKRKLSFDQVLDL